MTTRGLTPAARHLDELLPGFHSRPMPGLEYNEESSEAYDLHEKYRDYERAGVLEYVVVMLRDRAVRWFVRKEDRFKDLAATSDGVFHSSAMPGLWLDGPALFTQNKRQLVETLKKGLATPEHAAFVERLGTALE